MESRHLESESHIIHNGNIFDVLLGHLIRHYMDRVKEKKKRLKEKIHIYMNQRAPYIYI